MDTGVIMMATFHLEDVLLYMLVSYPVEMINGTGPSLTPAYLGFLYRDK